MQLASWNPFREMEELLQRQRRSALTGAVAKADLDWAPTVDIKESDSEYLIEAELPGVAKEDVNISVNNGILTLAGERHNETEDKDHKHHRIERFYGRFSRSFALPEDIDPEQIAADSQNGLIYIHMPKTEAIAPKAVKIEVD